MLGECSHEPRAVEASDIPLDVCLGRSRSSLLAHRGLIAAVIAELRTKMQADSDGGREITRDEMREALLTATSNYQLAAIEAIANELQRDYATLAGAAPDASVMERGYGRAGGRAPLLP
jgi:hypothetical protein